MNYWNITQITLGISIFWLNVIEIMTCLSGGYLLYVPWCESFDDSHNKVVKSALSSLKVKTYINFTLSYKIQ